MATRTVDAIGNELLVMVTMVFVAIVGVGGFSLWDAGYLGSYWERWQGAAGIKCFDAEGRVTASGQETCFVLTQRGLNARERLTEDCKMEGQDEDKCRDLAVKQLTSSLPRQRQ